MIVTGNKSDKERIISTLTVAFCADPIVRWMYPDPDRYLAHFSEFVDAYGGDVFSHNSAFYAADDKGTHKGVLLCSPPGVHADEDVLSEFLQRTASNSAKRDSVALFEKLGRGHPKEPHWALSFLGIDFPYRNRGVSLALMRHVLRICDRDGTPAYADCSHSGSYEICQKLGFELLDPVQIGDAPPIFPVLRTPR
jgi:hypothetical protein